MLQEADRSRPSDHGPATKLAAPESGMAVDPPHLPDRPPPRYFVSSVVDPFVIGGASILLYFAFRAVPQWGASPRVIAFGAFMVWSVNYPHFASTNYRLYHDRSNVGQYPLTALLVPVLVIGAMVGSFMSPAIVAPAFVMLYQLWSPYHFGGQTIGITMLYARRHRYPLDGWLRRSMTAFIIATFVLQIARFEVGDHETKFFGVTYPSLGLPTWAPRVAEIGMWSAAACFAVLLAARTYTTRRAIPFMVLLPAVTQYFWFAAAPAGNFYYLVPFFHSLQYLLIVWNLQLAETLVRERRAPSPRFVIGASARWIVVIVAGGYAMFWLVPRLGSHLGRSMAFSSAIVLAGLQLHHFFVDGVIWRLRNPSVRSPLSSSIPELLGRRTPTHSSHS